MLWTMSISRGSKSERENICEQARSPNSCWANQEKPYEHYVKARKHEDDAQKSAVLLHGSSILTLAARPLPQVPHPAFLPNQTMKVATRPTIRRHQQKMAVTQKSY